MGNNLPGNSVYKKIKRIYIIDDDVIDREYTKRLILKLNLTKNILLYTYADEALDDIANNGDKNSDLLLLDINIPRMNGFEFIKQLKLKTKSSNIPRIALITTSGSDRDYTHAKSHDEIISYVQKPLTEKALMEILELINH